MAMMDSGNGTGKTHTGHVGLPTIDECERCGKSGEWVRGCISMRGDTEAYHGYSAGKLCRGCHMDLLPDPQILYTELLDDTFTFYYGAASGSARKALRKMEEPCVMVSYATKNNGRIGPEDVHFTDSGGAPGMFTQGRYAETGDYVTSDGEYVDYIRNVEADLWSLRDYPCEDTVLDKHDRTVADHQQMTTDRHRSLLNKAADRGVTEQPVSIVQGKSVDDYITHLDQLRDAGVLTDYVGIGSICGRDCVGTIEAIIKALRDELSERHALHAFGVKKTVLSQTNVLSYLTSADSCAYDYGLRMESQYGNGERYYWRTVLREYLEYKTEIGKIIEGNDQDEQTTWADFGKSQPSPLTP